MLGRETELGVDPLLPALLNRQVRSCRATFPTSAVKDHFLVLLRLVKAISLLELVWMLV